MNNENNPLNIKIPELMFLSYDFAYFNEEDEFSVDDFIGYLSDEFRSFTDIKDFYDKNTWELGYSQAIKIGIFIAEYDMVM